MASLILDYNVFVTLMVSTVNRASPKVIYVYSNWILIFQNVSASVQNVRVEAANIIVDEISKNDETSELLYQMRTTSKGSHIHALHLII